MTKIKICGTTKVGTICTQSYIRRKNKMITHGNQIEVLAGNSNIPLAKAVAEELGLSLNNGEE